MSILQSGAANFTMPASQTCGFQNKSSASNPFRSSPPASSISKNAKRSRSKRTKMTNHEMSKVEATPNVQMTKTAGDVSSFGSGRSLVIKHSSFAIRSAFHRVANRAAAIFMKLIFGSVARVYVLRRGHSNRSGGFLLASNHISHFDPFIISSVVRRKIDWMAMAEFFPLPLLGFFLRAFVAFPAERARADRKTIRTAIERLKQGRIVGLFPEGGIRDGARSLLEGAALRLGASTLAHIAGVPILPCVIVGSDRLYSKSRWLPLRRTPIWIAFGDPIPHFADLEKSAARACIEHELAHAFKLLYAELREKFSLTSDDLPQPPRERFGLRGYVRTLKSADPVIAGPRSKTARFAASGVDWLMCASINLLQLRHRLHARSREEMERYVTTCEKLTAEDYYAMPNGAEITTAISDRPVATITWRSPIDTKFPANNIARADFFPCARG